MIGEWLTSYLVESRREGLCLLLTEAEADALVAAGHNEIPPKPPSWRLF